MRIPGAMATALCAVLAVVGCDGNATAPTGELSTTEALDLAPQYDALSSAALDQITLVSLLSGPGSSQVSRTQACPKGGEAKLEGSGTVTGDRASGTWSVTHTATATLSACAFETGQGTLVRLDGQLTITGVRRVVNFQLSGPQTTTEEGAFSWARGSGSGSCAIDLTSSYDPATRTGALKGTLCGRDVDRTLSGPRT